MKYKIEITPIGVLKYESALYRRVLFFFWKRECTTWANTVHSEVVIEWQKEYNIPSSKVYFIHQRP